MKDERTDRSETPPVDRRVVSALDAIADALGTLRDDVQEGGYHEKVDRHIARVDALVRDLWAAPHDPAWHDDPRLGLPTKRST